MRFDDNLQQRIVLQRIESTQKLIDVARHGPGIQRQLNGLGESFEADLEMVIAGIVDLLQSGDDCV